MKEAEAGSRYSWLVLVGWLVGWLELNSAFNTI